MNQTPLLLGLCLFSSVAFSQPLFRIDSLPRQGIVLDKGWKFHVGDNPDWANPNFDDSRWDSFNPAIQSRQLPQQGIGWLRIRLQIAPPLRGKTIGLLIQQSGASDLFLNGKLVGQNGQISPQKRIEVGAGRGNLPFIALSADSVQLLAIRYAFSNEQWLPVKWREAFVVVRAVSTEFAQVDSVDQLSTSMWETLLFGIFLALGILQLLLYVVSTQQQATLNLGLFLVTQGITHLIATDSLIKVTGVTQVGLTLDLLKILFTIALTLSGYCYLIGIYQYFQQPKRFLFYTTAALTLATTPICFFFPSFEGLALFILAILVPWLEILRIGVVSLKQKKSGAKLFTIAHGVLVAVFIVYTLAVFVPSFSNFIGHFGDNLFLISFLGLALTISLLLSNERAATNKLLRKQLAELEKLSQKTIAQEQEKQHLLATQNERLEQEVEARTAELKASQAQLIQKEKLASLGELTAGIAHEIQNPLNFVNNFSEVSAELVAEQKEALAKGDLEEAGFIADDLSSNLHKINHHGGRAAAIVRGMLEHSRTDSGEKRPTDLNALVDEYLKIAYHGLRAKDKNFTCELVTDFDGKLSKVDVVPQEIGRVVLNLFNNALYAVNERAKQTSAPDYKPRVGVRTRRLADKVEVQVSDNGTGIPESIKAKIFQPFFTTKPTGEGTGLGLSLSYDIVTKGHGGTLTVESTEGKGTEFVLSLPTQHTTV
ncbi:ATP-binding protein [Fibrisoma limi]|nr:ATP-binding protein [Fibrisoma limi]